MVTLEILVRTALKKRLDLKHLSDTLYIILSYRFVPLHVKVGLFEIVGLGTVAGIAATYSAMSDLIANKFTVPCYVNPTKA